MGEEESRRQVEEDNETEGDKKVIDDDDVDGDGDHVDDVDDLLVERAGDSAAGYLQSSAGSLPLVVRTDSIDQDAPEEYATAATASTYLLSSEEGEGGSPPRWGVPGVGRRGRSARRQRATSRAASKLEAEAASSRVRSIALNRDDLLDLGLARASQVSGARSPVVSTLRRQGSFADGGSNTRSGPGSVKSDGTDGEKDEVDADEVPVAELDERFFSLWKWPAALWAADADLMMARGGVDALLYMEMLKVLVYILCFQSLWGCIVLLPMYSAGANGYTGFRGLTLSNVASFETAKLWVVLLIAVANVCVVFVFVVVFRSFKRRTIRSKRLVHSPATAYTAWIRDLPSARLDTWMLVALRDIYMPVLFPTLAVSSVTVVPATMNLRQCLRERRRLRRQRAKAARSWGRTGDRPTMRLLPWHDGYEVGGDNLVDSMRYYSAKIDAIDDAVRTWLSSPKKSVGSAFIVFSSRSDLNTYLSTADEVHRRWASGDIRERALCNSSTEADVITEMKLDHVTVDRAPSKGNIMWENLHVSRTERLARMIGVNFVVLLALIFLSTPTAVWSMLASSDAATGDDSGSTDGATGSVLFAFGPSLVMFLVSVSLPYLFIVSTSFEATPTKSVLENWRLRKTYWLLVFYILILPSCAVASINKFIALVTSSPEALAHVVALADSAALFINYSVQVSFCLASFDLARPHEMVRTWYMRWRSVTVADEVRARESRRFDYGLQYSWNVALLALFVSFSCFAPLISPLGALAFGYRYWVDKANFLLVKKKAYDSSGTIVSISLHFVAVSTFIFQLFMVGFFFFEGLPWHTAVMAASLVVTAAYAAHSGVAFVNRSERQHDYEQTTSRTAAQEAAEARKYDVEYVDPVVESAAHLMHEEVTEVSETSAVHDAPLHLTSATDPIN